MIDEVIKWILEISIASMSIGVTTILGVQIWNTLSINKLIDRKLEKERQILRKEISLYYSKSKHLSSSLSSFNLAFTLKETGSLTPAFHAYMQAIISANTIGAEDVCETYIVWLIELLKKAAIEGKTIEITPQQRLEYVSSITNLTSEKFETLKRIFVADENAVFKEI
jgi:hypothetical protein